MRRPRSSDRLPSASATKRMSNGRARDLLLGVVPTTERETFDDHVDENSATSTCTVRDSQVFIRREGQLLRGRSSLVTNLLYALVESTKRQLQQLPKHDHTLLENPAQHIMRYS